MLGSSSLVQKAHQTYVVWQKNATLVLARLLFWEHPYRCNCRCGPRAMDYVVGPRKVMEPARPNTAATWRTHPEPVCARTHARAHARAHGHIHRATLRYVIFVYGPHHERNQLVHLKLKGCFSRPPLNPKTSRS